jgi:nucleoside-diphosphate-sugar epimerase
MDEPLALLVLGSGFVGSRLLKLAAERGLRAAGTSRAARDGLHPFTLGAGRLDDKLASGTVPSSSSHRP